MALRSSGSQATLKCGSHAAEVWAMPYRSDSPAQHSALPLDAQASDKSYAMAVVLSAVFGFVGVQHFYLGRWLEGLLDVGLSIGWVAGFALGEPVIAIGLLLLDIGHSFVVTIMLLTGSFRDGDGLLVCYPGQKLKHPMEALHHGR